MSTTLYCQSYPILIQRGLTATLHSHLTGFGSRLALITSDRLRPLYADAIHRDLLRHGISLSLFCIPDGEKYKTRATKEALENTLLENGLGADSCLIALGGGVITDLVGFVAATLCRGTPLISIPTSLLSMTDASIGGKNGVDTPYGKNLIGSIHPPQRIFIDPSFLSQLPLREIRNGIVEMIKHALLADATLFSDLESDVDALLALQPHVIDPLLIKSIQIKIKIVEEDRNTGKRHLLNLGHTVGHALEHLSNYTLAHGEAVALGLLMEGIFALQLGTLTQEEWDRIYHLLQRCGLPLIWPPSISCDALLNGMMLDKKTLGGKPRFVLLQGIGAAASRSAYCISVEEKVIRHAFDQVQHALRRH